MVESLLASWASLAGLGGTVHAQAGAASETRLFMCSKPRSIAIHTELRSGRLSCVQLVQAYLDRLTRMIRRTVLNAIQNLNPAVLKTAAELGCPFRHRVNQRPAACIPVLVKDEVNTDFMRDLWIGDIQRPSFPKKNANHRSSGCRRPARSSSRDQYG